MKKIIFLIFFLYGCGPSLQELRETSTNITLTMQKDAFCVYSKLNNSVFTTKSNRTWDESSWHSIWDPSTNTGEIFNIIPPGKSYVILFVINTINTVDSTTIKIKIAEGHGRSPLVTRWNQEYALKILSSADFSSCPDL